MIVKNVEKKENNTATFQVESDAAEFEAAVQSAYLKNRSSINIPGFRKGHAPRAIVENMYGREVFYQEAMDELAPKAFEQGLTEAELRIVGQPAINNVEVTEERTVVYTFAVSLYPEVTLGQYKGLKAPKDVTEVSDEEVEEELEKARKQNARKISVEDREAQMGDTANIDFDGYLNGERFDGGKAEGYDLELGSNSFVPGFEEQVVGMKIGEEKDLDITFPETYVENLAGKAVVFKVKLNSLTYPELPELDDEFAKDVSEFDTLEEYKADLRKKLQERYEEQAENAFRSLIMKQAADNMSVDVPDAMIQEKAEEIVRNYAANFGMTDRNIEMEKLVRMLGIDSETMNQSILPSAQLQVRTELLLEAVAKAENIELTEEETDAYLQRIAESVNAKPEEIKEYFGLETIRNEYKKEKATNIIMESAEVGEMEEPAPAEETEETKE
jgi:trigger factor